MRGLASAVEGVHFPVGESDFASIRRSGQFFADNSAHIRTVENMGKQLIFTRPPRWGKSLFVDMMCVYYDKNTSESDFMELFGGLDIGKSPTVEARSFCVLPIDLTVSVHAEMPVDVIEKRMYDCINGRVTDYALRYGMPVDALVDPLNAAQSLHNVANDVRRRGDKLYVLIDEYDRVANKLMFENPERYLDIVGRKEAGTSPLRGVLETLKAIKPTRTFVTGITTLALADASGANSFRNVSAQPHLGSMLGFTEGHLRRALADIQLEPAITESALELMRAYFNGYRFHGTPDETPLFNPQQCLYFLSELALGSMTRLLADDAWKEMEPMKVIARAMDKNLRMSDNVIGVISRSPTARADVTALASGPVAVEVSMLDEPYRLHEMLAPSDTPTEYAVHRTRAFMFSHGIVTLAKGATESVGELVIPNKIARHDYLDKLRVLLQSQTTRLVQMMQFPTALSVQDFVEGVVEMTETPLDKNFKEVGLQASVEVAFKCLQQLPLYKIQSEIKVNKFSTGKDGYGDVLMTSPDTRVALLLELGRVRFDQLTPSFDKHDTNKERWTLPEAEAKIAAMSEADVLALKARRSDRGPHIAVRDWLGEKVKQVADYKVPAELVPPSYELHRFAVLQVGRRIIVRASQAPEE